MTTILSRITVGRLLQSTVIAVVCISLTGEIAKALVQVHAGHIEEVHPVMRFWLFALLSGEKLTSMLADERAWAIASLTPSLFLISSLAFALWVLLRSPDRKEVQL